MLSPLLSYISSFLKAIIMKKRKKATTPSQKKIAEVMHEFKEGALHSGKSDVIVTNPKQAIAIALSEADELEKENAEKRNEK
jgi:Family of unknown function (DUF6496)